MPTTGVSGSPLRRPAEGQGTMTFVAPLKQASRSPHPHQRSMASVLSLVIGSGRTIPSAAVRCT